MTTATKYRSDDGTYTVRTSGEAPQAVVDPYGNLRELSEVEEATKKKQTTRMLKVVCPDEDCGYTLRTTAKWLDEVGPPFCACSDLATGELVQMVDTRDESEG